MSKPTTKSVVFDHDNSSSYRTKLMTGDKAATFQRFHLPTSKPPPWPKPLNRLIDQPADDLLTDGHPKPKKPPSLNLTTRSETAAKVVTRQPRRIRGRV